MNKTKSALIFIISSLFTSSAFASLITVEYSVDFTAYMNNSDWFASPPSDFDTLTEQNEYLVPDDLFITVLYDTKRAGTVSYANTGEIKNYVGIWAQILDTNISLPTENSEHKLNYVAGYTRNRGEDYFLHTALASSIWLNFDIDIIEELYVGATSFDLGLFSIMPGEHVRKVKSSRTDQVHTDQAYNKYQGVAIVQSITTVPEPSSLLIFGASLFGLFSCRLKISGSNS